MSLDSKYATEGLVCVRCGPAERSVRKTGQGSGVPHAAWHSPGAGRAQRGA